MTVATQSREQKKIIVDYLEKTGTHPRPTRTPARTPTQSPTRTLDPNPNPNPNPNPLPEPEPLTLNP